MLFVTANALSNKVHIPYTTSGKSISWA